MKGEFFIKYICPICGNEDLRYIGKRNGKPYCRRCISFYGEEVTDDETYPPINSSAVLKYPLSKEQLRISNEVKTNYINGFNTLIYAVCGAGKTELVFSVIEYALKHAYKVGFAIPRKDVVRELLVRFKNTFINNNVVSVYGGNTNILNGDIIVLTTHQLYRYHNFFDLLILDEIDAFPYKDNDVLINFFKKSIKGNYILMSATPSPSVLEEFKKPGHKILKLFTRYHMKPIPIPKVVIRPGLLKIIFLIKKLKEYKIKKLPCFVFVPTIDDSESLFKIINIFVKNGNFVNSKIENRSEVINGFRNKKYDFLITTAVLERGVTVKNLQVIVYDSDHQIYNSASVIKISGRVVRVYGVTDGEVIYLGSKKTNEMVEAIKKTKEANTYLQNLL